MKRLASEILKEASGESEKCGHCGFCQAVCPIYRNFPTELAVARGRNVTITELAEGKLELSAELKDVIFNCLLCRACVEACFSAIETDKATAAARHALVRAFGQPLPLKMAFNVVLRSNRLQNLLARGGWFAGKAGLGLLMRAMGRLSDTAALASRGLEVARPIPHRSLRAKLRRQRPGEKYDAAYFLGCAINQLFPDVGAATLRCLKASGYMPYVLRNVCCGLPAYANGDLNAARKAAVKNLELFQAADLPLIVSECAGCSSFLKSYPELFPQSDPYHELACEMASRVADASEVFAAEKPRRLSRSAETGVTYHDPCHLSRYQKITSEPRELLSSIPGINLVEMKEAARCCGGGGTYTVFHPREADAILEEKIKNATASGACVMATACPACMVQLRYGVRRFNAEIRVVHVTELLAQALRPENSAS